MTTASAGLRIIEPSSGWVRIGWRELWDYRELLGFLVWRDVKVRYKQTVLGAGWAVLQPLVTMVDVHRAVRAVGEDAVGRRALSAVRVRGVAALDVLRERGQCGGVSLVGNTHLISKVYFPRLLVSLAPLGTGLVDFAIALAVMLGMCCRVRRRLRCP